MYIHNFRVKLLLLLIMLPFGKIIRFIAKGEKEEKLKKKKRKNCKTATGKEQKKEKKIAK